MCRPIGFFWCFCAVLVWKRRYTLPILVWDRVWFLRELRECMNQPRSQGSLLPALRSFVGRVGENPENEVVYEPGLSFVCEFEIADLKNFLFAL